jgi:hypothetical protein
VSEGYCTSEPGPRKASLITLVKPYNEATDEKHPEPF